MRLRELEEEVVSLGSQAVSVVGDVVDPKLRSAALDAARHQFGGLDVLVNNAGVGSIGTFASADAARLRTVMEVNFFAAAELIRESVPLLRSGHDPAIVNIGSVLGHCAVPKKAEYCASKFALHGFTDALRMELRSEQIEVILVSPSTTRSEFFDRVLRSDGDATGNRFAMPASAVADRVVSALRNRRREVILTIGGKLLVVADRAFPSVVGWILTKLA